MKLKTISNPTKTYADVVAYKDTDGNLILHPNLFYSSWTDASGRNMTGYISVDTGVINAPISPVTSEEDYYGVVWQPEKYKLDGCMFAGDELTFILCKVYDNES